MTVVKLRCATCHGEHCVHLDTLRLFVCRDDAALSSMAFTCPTCGPQVQRMGCR